MDAIRKECLKHIMFVFFCLLDRRSSHLTGSLLPILITFSALKLSLWYETILLFLEQIAPSLAAHSGHTARTFANVARGKFSTFFTLLSYDLIHLCPLEFSFSIFVESSSSLSGVRKKLSNLGMSRFISLTKLFSAASYSQGLHYSTLNFKYAED